MAEEEHKVRSFKSATRKRQDSWVISHFVLLHNAAFAATMFVNDCWQNSNRDCALRVSDAFPFSPFWRIPFSILPPRQMVYILSAIFGSLLAALFLQNSPAVSSYGALFGLLGSMLSGLIRNWKVYTDKLAALPVLLLIGAINFALGLLPYVGNISNLGGFLSGVVLGLFLLFIPSLPRMT